MYLYFVRNLSTQEYAAVESEMALKETNESIRHVEEKIDGLLEREKELKKIIDDQETEKLSLIQEGYVICTTCICYKVHVHVTCMYYF